MSANGAIGHDPIANQPGPTRNVPLYNDDQMRHWPPPLREAYETWFDFVAEFTEYRSNLQQDPDRNGAEISHISRFVAFIAAPLEDGFDLRILEPVEEMITFQFAAVGPYGDLQLLADMYNDCLTHESITHDFRDTVSTYMQFLARYDPRYWHNDDHREPLDCFFTLQADELAASRQSDQCRDVVRNLQTEHHDLLDVEYDEGALDDEEEDRFDVVNEILEDSRRQWLAAHETRMTINGQMQVQILINDWLLTYREPRGQDANLRISQDSVRLPALRAPRT